MGRRKSWFSAVKKAFSHESKGKSGQRSRKSKKWFGKHTALDAGPSTEETEVSILEAPQPAEEVKVTEAKEEQTKHAVDEQTNHASDEQTTHTYSNLAMATAKAAEAAAAAAQAAAEVVRLAAIPLGAGKSKEDMAAIRIQTAFRGYMARRALHALRGLVRLKTLVQGQSVKRQATNTLRSMRTLARVQSQVRSRRLKLSEENQVLQQHLQRKRDRELKKLKAPLEGEFDIRKGSKEQIEKKLTKTQEAAMRRERALAYSLAHQYKWKRSPKPPSQTIIDPNDSNWGWSWLERWMAGRPWDGQSATNSNDQASVKTAGSRTSTVKQTGKTRSARDAAHAASTRAGKTQTARDVKRGSQHSPGAAKKGVQTRGRQTPLTSSSKAPSVSSVNMKSASPNTGRRWMDDDTRSLHSLQSESYRRHSRPGSCTGDNESLTSCSSVPSYMAPTKATAAKSQLPSPLGLANRTPDNVSVGSAKKRLAYPPSPARTARNSGSSRVDISSMMAIGNHS